MELVSATGAHGTTVLRASGDGAVIVRRDPRGGLVVSGLGVREPIWHGPVCHASTSLGAASEDSSYRPYRRLRGADHDLVG